MLAAVNSKDAMLRSCVGCWHPANYDAALKQYRNLGWGGSALDLLEPATPPTRVTGSGFVATYWPGGNVISVPVTTSTTHIKFRIHIKLSRDTITGTGYPLGDTNGWGKVYYTTNKIFRFSVIDESGAAQGMYSPGGQDLSDWAWYEFEYEVGGNQTIRKSIDGVNWTTIASQAATLPNIRTGTGATGFGGYSASKGNSEYVYRRIQIFNDGKEIPDVDLNPAAHLSDGLFTQTSIPNDGSAGGTATIKRSSSGLKTFAATGETQAAWVFDGTYDYLYVPDHDLLDFGPGEELTAGGVIRFFGTPGYDAIIAKKFYGTSIPGWRVEVRVCSKTYLANQSQMEASMTNARKREASFSYRVAIARSSLMR